MKVAVELGMHLRGAGASVDVDLVARGAAFHDIGKSPLLEGDPREHHELSALVLAAEGMPELAEIARRHIVYAVTIAALAPRTLEEKIVYYADRRVGQQLESVEERIRDLAQRYPGDSARILANLEPAKALERELLEPLGLNPEDFHPDRPFGPPGAPV